MDLNSDLGEGLGRWSMGDDPAMLAIVSSANIACGFHAGDPSIMRDTCRMAVERGVAIGAHVSYRDLAGFGRRFVDVDPHELAADVTYQIGALDAFARAAGGRVSYVKPHGALYNAIADHREQAAAVVAGIRAVGDLPLLGPGGSVALELARAAGLPTVAEGFVDRAYDADARLVDRRRPGAVLHDVDAIVTRAIELARTGRVATIEGTTVTLRVESLCVHGDTPGAVAIAAGVRQGLVAAGVAIEPFAR